MNTDVIDPDLAKAAKLWLEGLKEMAVAIAVERAEANPEMVWVEHDVDGSDPAPDAHLALVKYYDDSYSILEPYHTTWPCVTHYAILTPWRRKRHD